MYSVAASSTNRTTSSGSLSDTDNSLLSELDAIDEALLGETTQTRIETILAAVETFAFNALFAIVSRTSSLRIVSILVLLIEFGQLAAFAFAPIFEWGPWADSSLQPVLSVLSLRVVFSSFHIFRLINFAVYAALIAAACDAAYVGLALRDHSRSKIWPLRLLRYAVGFAVTVLYIPIMSVLLTPLACDYEAEPPVLRDYSDVGCWEVEITAYRMVSSVLALVFLMGTAALSLVYFQDALGSGHLLARPHARVDCATHVVKTVLLFGFATGAGSPGVLGGLLVVTMISIFVLQVLFMALYNLKLQLARTGGFLALAWLGSMALATVSVNGHPSDDGVSRGSNGVFVSALLIAPAVGVFGAVLAWLRLSKLWRRHTVATVGSVSSSVDLSSSRFILVTDVELVARMHMASGNIDAANSVFRAGFDQFPNSVFVVLCYVRFLASVGNTAMAHAYLDKSHALPAWIDLRFARYRKMREVEQAQLARGLTTGSMDLVSYVQFESMLRTAKSHHNSALRAVSTFWRTLLRSDRAFLEKSAKLIARIDESERTANNYYRQLVRKYPTAPGLLSAYATFLDEVSNKPALASRFLSKAKRVEAALRDSTEHGEGADAEAALATVNGAVDALVTLTEDGCIASLNTHARKLLGFTHALSRDELLHKPFGLALLAPSFSEWFHDMLADASTSPRPLLVTVRCKDKSELAVNMILARVPRADVAHFMVILRPVQTRSHRVALYCTKNGAVAALAGSVERMLGLDPEDLLGAPLSQVLSSPSAGSSQMRPNVSNGSFGSYRELTASTSDSSGLQAWLSTLDRGAVVPLAPQAVVIGSGVHAFGTGPGAMGMIVLESLATHTLEFAISAEGRILACPSSAAQALFGRSETEMLGQTLNSVFVVPDDNVVANNLPNVITEATHERAAHVIAEMERPGAGKQFKPAEVWVDTWEQWRMLRSAAVGEFDRETGALPLFPHLPDSGLALAAAAVARNTATGAMRMILLPLGLAHDSLTGVRTDGHSTTSGAPPTVTASVPKLGRSTGSTTGETMSLVSDSEHGMVMSARARLSAKRRLAELDSDVGAAVRAMKTKAASAVNRLKWRLCASTFVIACLCLAVFVASTILLHEAELEPPRAEWASMRLQEMSRTVSAVQSLYILDRCLAVKDAAKESASSNASTPWNDELDHLVEVNELLLHDPRFVDEARGALDDLERDVFRAIEHMHEHHALLANTDGLYDPDSALDKLHAGAPQVELYFFDGIGEVFAAYPAVPSRELSVTTAAYNLDRAIMVYTSMAQDFVNGVNERIGHESHLGDEAVRGVVRSDASLAGADDSHGEGSAAGNATHAESAEALVLADMAFFVLFNGRHTLRAGLEYALELEHRVVAATMEQSLIVVCSLTGILIVLHLVVVCTVVVPEFRRLGRRRRETMAVFLAIPKVSVSDLVRMSKTGRKGGRRSGTPGAATIEGQSGDNGAQDAKGCGETEHGRYTLFDC
ncbi:uncharacterized protein AMSG_11687 [Thecamonas trahens ATCC 50062]|uniref:PAS domain-containing protein n=1 Tax=Thecamonas trahens ATCC 50062 TaxID=461836 RepID=A0A0L0DV84_THETB|nr:hypothetical protein AMSG_11687 [Thecamonas trahens ATCC 50062]KNC56125.1 hypothetical protein AMSG_11687 [Thecamonas trahens ATCC 50062]|eukprot:XP_013761226.1 hypothetical protein AMSG_11687 [Thecamonas trahens ATCC 50062]